MSEFLPEAVVDQIIASQLHEGDVTFANGQLANNHLNLGYSETPPQLRTPIVDAFSRLLFAKNLRVDSIVPVPSGAVGWAEDYTTRQVNSQEIIRLQKLQKRQFVLANELERSLLAGKRGIVLDDATSDGGTGEAVADYMTEQGFCVTAVVSLFVRGQQLDPSKYPRLWLAHRTIPTQLDWNVYRQTGKLQQLTV